MRKLFQLVRGFSFNGKLNRKLNMMITVIMVPFIILVIYLLVSMINYCNSYNQIVKNVSLANSYNIDFKREIDAGMYQIAIGSAIPENILERKDIRNPYEVLGEAREDFTKLQKSTLAPGNARRVRRLIKTFDTLEKRMLEISQDAGESGHYEENLLRLDNNIRILTEVLQEAIQEYIHYETDHLESVRYELEQKEQDAVEISVTCLIVVIIGAVIVGFAISRSVVDPIVELCKTTEEVARGNFDVRVEVNSSDETAILAESFNRMISEMGELVEGIKQEQLNLRDAELKLLQAQINPHFLYNTLDTIMWMAEAGQKEEVVDLVSSLSGFFRTTLSKGRDFISVGEEVSHIQSYLEIQKFRYRDIMDYEIDIPIHMHRYPILKLTLQPLVENALYHGIKNKRGKGTIKVSGECKDDMLIFTIRDDGIGMTKEQLMELHSNIKKEQGDDEIAAGFGLANVNERIRLNYGKEYGLIFSSIYGQGTSVSVTIPVK
ncbi:sensor histidine kinase [Kineothrix sp. MB12-C1]|uniref:sensor histidine kinase n=1 Tax=Kineothrix sp. MB12-C1 TaxID=3070215 RepID=UPI0027D308E7|nr:sensor histidine kinase [Kineothrix sp. MB12-C1]WMC94255.1 sensor histidine kinase [Kineothrix sp. MB12-C1]